MRCNTLTREFRFLSAFESVLSKNIAGFSELSVVDSREFSALVPAHYNAEGKMDDPLLNDAVICWCI
jgi:hypothetical protein